MQLDAEALRDHRLEVDPPPAHHAIGLRIWPVLDDPDQFRLLLGREAWCRSRVRSVGEAGEPFGIVAMDPIAQGLPVHPGRAGRVLPRGARHNQRQGEHAPRRLGIAAMRCLPPQIARL